MKKSQLMTAGILSGGIAMLVAGSAIAATSTSSDGEAAKNQTRIVIRVASDLCEFDNELPSNLIKKLKRLDNYDRLVGYMLTNCPALALPLVDTPTASIVTSNVGEDGNSGNTGGGGSGNTGGSGGSGTTPGGSGGSGGDSDDEPSDTGVGSGGGKKDTTGDGNNGHGNDPGKRDSSNPGNKR